MNLRLFLFEVRGGLALFFKRRFQADKFFIFRKISFLILALALLPISLVLYLFRWRYCDIYCSRIGHQIAEYFYAVYIKQNSKPFTVRKDSAANRFVYDYYRDLYTIDPPEPLALLVRATYVWPWMRLNVEDAIRTDSLKIYETRNVKHAKFELTGSHLRSQRLLLRDLGLNRDRYICIHVRTEGYSPADDERFAYRNSGIDNLLEALKRSKLAELKLVVVGDKNKFDCQGVINYPNTNFHSPINDILLISGAEYFIGNSSGLHLLAWAFNVKTLVINMIPYTSVPYHRDIPFLRKNMVFHQALTSTQLDDISNAYNSNEFINLGVELVENTQSQILSFINSNC